MTDKQLVSTARAMRRGILGKRSSADMCMVVSAPLQGFLSAVYMFDTTLEEVDFGETNHVFLRLSDGRILDATADQFGLEPVYLGEMPELYREWSGLS
jgi:hypothetical protein